VQPYADDEHAALYDLFYSDYDDDLALYDNFARRGETASLEIGVGTGRVALHLAQQELDVCGLDSSPAMLRRLAAKLAERGLSKRVRAVEGDVRSFELAEHFDLIFCAANTFQHLTTTDDQVAALGSCAKHLTPGGVFVAKLDSPSNVDWSEDVAGLRLSGARVDPASGETVMRFTARQAHASTMTTDVTQLYDRIGRDGTVRRHAIEYSLKYMTPDELALLLQRAGLRLLQMYGDHELSPFDAASDSMIFVAGLEG
jgi:SAM-dependent methyltransferase